jgi:hypothetical protein
LTSSRFRFLFAVDSELPVFAVTVAFGRRGLALRLLGLCRGLVHLSAALAVRGQLAATTRARTPDPASLIIRGDAGTSQRLNESGPLCRT